MGISFTPGPPNRGHLDGGGRGGWVPWRPTNQQRATNYYMIILLCTFWSFFFYPPNCTYTSSPLDGMAKNYLLSTWIHKIMQFIMSGSILFLPPFTRGEKKPFGLSWNRNPSPLASQANALTTRPWLLGLKFTIDIDADIYLALAKK